MKKIIILFLLVITFSCAPIYVDYDYERTADFKKYKTYNYYSDIETGLSELDSKRFIDALNKQMELRGFSISETPDFYLNIVSSLYEIDNKNTVGIGVGGTGNNVGGGITIGLPIGQSKMNRQIVFEFIDENGIGLFWQAVSESGFNPNASPQKREERLTSIISKVLSGFPPEEN